MAWPLGKRPLRRNDHVRPVGPTAVVEHLEQRDGAPAPAHAARIKKATRGFFASKRNPNATVTISVDTGPLPSAVRSTTALASHAGPTELDPRRVRPASEQIARSIDATLPSETRSARAKNVAARSPTANRPKSSVRSRRSSQAWMRTRAFTPEGYDLQRPRTGWRKRAPDRHPPASTSLPSGTFGAPSPPSHDFDRGPGADSALLSVSELDDEPVIDEVTSDTDLKPAYSRRQRFKPGGGRTCCRRAALKRSGGSTSASRHPSGGLEEIQRCSSSRSRAHPRMHQAERHQGHQAQSGLRDLGGVVRASAVLASADLVPEIEARSLVVRVTMDESEIERRGAAQREAMRRAFPDRARSRGRLAQAMTLPSDRYLPPRRSTPSWSLSRLTHASARSAP